MKSIPLLLALVIWVTTACTSTRNNRGRGASNQLPAWLLQFCNAAPLDDSLGWKAQIYRLPEPRVLTARRLIRHTGIRPAAPLRIDRYLEIDDLLVHAGAFQIMPNESGYTLPVAFECRHWFVISGDGQIVVQRLDFLDRQTARIRLVFRRHDPISDIPDFARARPLKPRDQTTLQNFAIEPKPFFYRQILPGPLAAAGPVTIEHYWRHKDQLLRLANWQYEPGGPNSFTLRFGGEHWFRLTANDQTLLYRYILDETQPGLWQLHRYNNEPLWPPVTVMRR